MPRITSATLLGRAADSATLPSRIISATVSGRITSATLLGRVTSAPLRSHVISVTLPGRITSATLLGRVTSATLLGCDTSTRDAGRDLRGVGSSRLWATLLGRDVWLPLANRASTVARRLQGTGVCHPPGGGPRRLGGRCTSKISRPPARPSARPPAARPNVEAGRGVEAEDL